MPWWRSPWSSVAAVVAPAALLLWGVTVPGGYFDVLVAALVAWSVVGLAWLVAGVACVEALPRPRRRHLGRLWPLLVVPIVFAVSWTVASGDLVGRAMFSLHRSELERLTAEDAARPDGVYPPWGVGLYSFEAVSRAQGCVKYAVSDPGMAASAGFAWCPGRVPMDDDSEKFDFERFDGDWYVFIVRHGPWSNRFQGTRPWGLQISELTARTPT